MTMPISTLPYLLRTKIILCVDNLKRYKMSKVQYNSCTEIDISCNFKLKSGIRCARF